MRFRDVFTVFYSTFLASAAIADTSRKDARLQEWEMLIQGAREELQAIEDDQRDRVASLFQRKESDISMPPIPTRWQTVFDLARQKWDDREALGFRNIPGPPLSLLKQLNAGEIEQLMSDPKIARLRERTTCGAEWGRRTTDLTHLSEKKIKTIAWSVRKLSYRLLQSSKEARPRPQKRRDSRSIQSRLNPIQSQINLCDEKLFFLRSRKSDEVDWQYFEPPTSPTYHRVMDNVRLSPNHYLRFVLKDFLRDLSDDQRNQRFLSDVSTILLDSRLPPDIHFFNNLILWLIRIKRWNDVRAVIESMRESHIKPNKLTLSFMLRFYTLANDRYGFEDLTIRMKGLRGGLAIVNPYLRQSHMVKWRHMVTEVFAASQFPDAADKRLPHEDSTTGQARLPAGETWPSSPGVPILHEGARMNCMNSQTYAQLIDGTLKLIGPRAATRYYLQMAEDGWWATLNLLNCILESCLRLQNWEDGVAVWKQICKLPDSARQGRQSERSILSSMLELCRCHRKYIEFGQVLDHGVRNRVLPPTVWDFPEEIAQQSIPDLSRNADTAPANRNLRFSIFRFRNNLERDLELLAYGIAKTALDIAELGGSWSSFNVYVRVRQVHKDSPRALLFEKKNFAFQRLADRVEQDRRFRRDPTVRAELQRPLPPIESGRQKHDRAVLSSVEWRSIPLSPSEEPSAAVPGNTTGSRLHEADSNAQESPTNDSIETVEPAPATDKDSEPKLEGFFRWISYTARRNPPQPPRDLKAEA